MYQVVIDSQFVRWLQAGTGGDAVLAGLCEQLAEVQHNLQVDHQSTAPMCY